ncbi:copper resistance protein CopC [Citricoccus sp. GCM10030269]|uniref:copper resistance protein CopC n=1 Tax=Citricoccus sp. GCM10030269 TaxID=3273388 RepID=UPI003615A73D
MTTTPSTTPIPTNHRLSRTSRPRTTGAAAASAVVAACAVVALATASPAAAHDELLSTSPEAGTTVLTAPTEVTLAFSGDPITGQGVQNLITVTDDEGHQWQDGDAQVSGAELSADLCEGLHNGEYEVEYRVVYSDGHSDEKSYEFTLDDPDAPDAAVPEDCGVPNPEASVAQGGASASADTASPGAATAESASPDANGSASDASDASDTAGTPDPAGTASGEATAADSQAPAEQLPGWVWPAALGAVVVVVLAMVTVFRKAKNIDGGTDTP